MPDEGKRSTRPRRKSIILDALLFENSKFVGLSDRAQLAYIAILCKAKWQHPAGQFTSAKHLEACVGRHARAFKELVGAGLLDVKDGGVVIHDWAEYQQEPSTDRVRAWRTSRKGLVVVS